MKYKFRGHETFAIRKGWLSKGLKQVQKNGEVFLSKTENPMDVLGIGANMVKSLRYWLQAVGLTEEPLSGKRIQSISEFGEIILQQDAYMEETGTLQLLHYNLAKNKDLAPSWYHFFHEFNGEISEDEFTKSLINNLNMANEEIPAIRSIQEDFACIINTYLPRHKVSPEKDSPESNMDCPLSELGLLDYSKGKGRIFQKKAPSIKSINPWIVLAIIAEQAGDQREIPLQQLSTAPCNIGKTFNLDTITLLETLYAAEKIGELKIVRTAGLDVIHRTHPEYSFINCINHYYTNIKGLE